METFRDFLNALYPETAGIPRLEYVEGSPIEVDDLAAFLSDAGADPIYAYPVTAAGEAVFVFEFAENAAPGEWQDFRLQPTAVLTEGSRAIYVWALDVPCSDVDRITALMERMGGAYDEPCPTPGDWLLEHADPDIFYEIDALEEAFGVAPATPQPGRIGDAVAQTPFDPNDPTYAQDMTVSIGAGRDAVKWLSKTMSVASFIDLLSHHRENSKKDGLAFVLAEIVGPHRRKVAVRACSGVGLDIDAGTPSHVIDNALADLGCLAVRYTTHSHGRTLTEIRKDRLIRYADKLGCEVQLETVRRFLSEEERWDRTIVETAEYTCDEHRPEGLMAQIAHAPMPKHRVVVPFLNSFDISKVAKTHDDGMKLWTEVPKALARRLGDLPLDKAALDPSRLFFFPRHKAGAPFEVTLFGGPLLDWRSLDLDGNAAADAFDRALAVETAGAGSGKSRSTTQEGKDLGRWSIEHAHGFQIADAIRDHAEDRIRTNGAHKIEIECPFDEDHSNAGDPDDRACFAVNAGDGPSDIFTIRCAHDSCRERTNLDHLGRMLRDGWLPQDVLDDDTYNVAVEDDSEASFAAADLARQQQAEARRQAARDAYQEAIDALTPDSPDNAVEGAVRLVLEADLSVRALSKAKDALCAHLKLGKREVAALLKEGDAALIDEVEAAEATPVDARFADLAQAIPLPDREFGAYTYRPFKGRAWVHAHDVRLWTPWAITGAVTYPDRDGVDGLRLRVEKVGGAMVDFDIPADVTTDPKGMKSILRLRGVGLTSEGMERLTGLAAQINPDSPTRAYGWGGWRESGTFLTPWGRPIGVDLSLSVAAEARPKGEEIAGTFEGWRAAIDAAFATGLRQLQLLACASYASTIIGLCKSKLTSGVLFISGAPEAGKTTGHKVQVSAWGDPAPGRGLLGNLDLSAQAPEVLLARASGAGAALDEVKHYGHKLQDLIFRISGDLARGRAQLRNDALNLQEQRAWRLLVTMSYEKTLEHRIRVEDGQDVFGGLGARCVEVPADLTKLSRQAMAPVDAIKTNFGHGGARFVQALIAQGYAADPAKLESKVEALADALLLDTPTDQRRAARLMAAVWAAGEIAQSAGLIPLTFPLEPPEDLWALTPENDARRKSKAPNAEDAEPQEDDVAKTRRERFEAMDDLGRMIVQAWRLSREMDSASTDPVAKAVDALMRNLAMGRGVVDQGDTARTDTRAVRIHNFRDLDGAVFVVTHADLPALIDGSADPSKVRKALRSAEKLILHEHQRGPRTVLETSWGHVPGFGPGPAIIIPVDKVQQDS